MFPSIQILVKRFSIALFFASLCRLAFLLFNPSFLSVGLEQLSKAFFYGLAYDISALIYFHAIFIFLHFLPYSIFIKVGMQKLMMFLFLLAQLLFIFFNLVDTGFYAISGRRSGVELLDMTKETNGLVTRYLIDYWYLFLLLCMFVWVNYIWYKKINKGLLKEYDLSSSLWKDAGIRLVFLFLIFIGARGGLNLLPLNPFDAARQTQASLIPLVINTPFNMIISTQQKGLEQKSFMDEKLCEDVYPIYKQVKENKELIQPRNIMLIIVESLGKEYIGFYNNHDTYTPFLDSLMQHSEVYMHAFANGKKSIEGIPAILSAMPSWLPIPYLSSYYQSNSLNSIGAYLKEMGYTTSFYHGGKNGTMSFDNYLALSNGGSYFGMNEYPDKKDFDGYWGISDRPYLAYVAKENSLKKQPFFSTVFTLTSHHPYQLPASEIGNFEEGTLPIHKTIRYTDDALRSFFSVASKQPWYTNTTFIITADHSAENELKYYQGAVGKYEIPLIVFRPGNDSIRYNFQTVSQLDIMGIALEEAQFSKPFFSFGSRQHKQDTMSCAVQYHDGYYQIIKWPFVLNFDGTKSMAFYKLDADSLLKNNLINQNVFSREKAYLDHKIRAIIQLYNNRVIANKTY
ncbi:MAG: LTA synthase family protein [Bacteroidia bacterium]|nr:LTA synthase family protein [Bacteroidia bacterium]